MIKPKTGRGGNVKKGKNRQQRRRPPTPVKLVRISGELIDRIDAIKPDMVPREPYIRMLLEHRVTEIENEEEEE